MTNLRLMYIAAVLCVAFPLTLSGQQMSVPAQLAETTNLWFVELSSPPTTDGGTVAAAQNDKQLFRARARAEGIVFQERYAFNDLFNGVSIQMNPADRAKLARLEGVKAIYPVAVIPRPVTTQAPLSPQLFSSKAMIGADIAQSELGFTGKGVKVAVMDTGIDYHHPDLGGCFGPGCRVFTGWDFVGDAFNGLNTPIPDNDPDDCYGHGTHVAGIIGANGVVKGVAPEVQFGAYRVFGCQGSTTSDIMLAAMERALADKMQVLNMSVGNPFQWPEYPTAAAATRLVNKGMVVVASIGNYGANGLYSAGAPGVGKKVIGVASFDNTHATLKYFTISPDGTKIGYIPAVGVPDPPTSGSNSMARTGTPTTTNDACSPLPASSLTGKVALIRRGTCTFYTKAYNAQQAGAVGVVIYNNTAGLFSPAVTGSPSVTIPVVAISDTHGVLINNRLAAGSVDMTWTNESSQFVTPTGNLISNFSSYGLAPDLSLKPDIGAPGAMIYSTYPIELGGYSNMSGTSMSSPHVAGAAALLLQAKPKTPSQIVCTILQNSAEPKPWWGNPALGFLDNVHRQGAGMLRIDRAILATTKIEPGKLELGESQSPPATRTIQISNDSGSPVTYNMSFVNALSTGGNTFAPSFFTSDASVSFSPASVTIPPGGKANVAATIKPATGPEKGLYGGYIVATPQGMGPAYRVPFAGFVGDYQSIQVLAPTSYGFPWLAKLVGDTYYKQPGQGSYTMVGADIPYFLIHLDHQSRRLRMEVFDAVSGKAWHRAYSEEYLPRNSTSTSFFVFPWDGTTTNGNKVNQAPNGAYVVKLTIEKALSDGSPAHTETWTSPIITIARP